MSKKPSVKNKEVNPLLKSLNIEKMNSTQIQQEITKEEKLLNNFISHYKYHEAEICDNKISALKKVLKQKKAKEINQRHTAEKEHLKIDEFSVFIELFSFFYFILCLINKKLSVLNS